MDRAKVRLSIPEDIDATRIFGAGDAVLRALEGAGLGDVVVRGDTITLTGTTHEVEMLTRLFTHLIQEARAGSTVSAEDAIRALRSLQESSTDLSSFRDDILLTYRGRAIRPKTVGQKRYIDAIRANTVTFCMGPAGTGKTYLAMAMAVAALKRHEVGRIVLTRPVVEAGENLGFLPGYAAGENRSLCAAAFRCALRPYRYGARGRACGAGCDRDCTSGLHARPHP